MFYRPITIVFSADTPFEIVIPDGFRLVCFTLGESPSHVPAHLMPSGRYELTPEVLPGGKFPMGFSAIDAAHINIIEKITPEMSDTLLAKAIEARRAETLGSVHESAVAEPFAEKDHPHE